MCLVMTNIAVEVEHSFMTFLAQSGLQDKNMYQREEERKSGCLSPPQLS